MHFPGGICLMKKSANQFFLIHSSQKHPLGRMATVSLNYVVEVYFYVKKAAYDNMVIT
jgi:hypothetical protein